MLDVSILLAETIQATAALKAVGVSLPEEAEQMREIMERCVAAEAERDRLRQAIWPGLPKFVPSEDFPQQNFYEAVAEGLRSARYPAIRLCRDGDFAVVSMQDAGDFVELIREPYDAPFSHIIESEGVRKLIEDR